MKKILLVLLILQLIPVSFVQAQNVYHNDEGHFSFTLPNDWERLSQSTVDDVNNKVRQAGANATSNSLSITVNNSSSSTVNASICSSELQTGKLHQ